MKTRINYYTFGLDHPHAKKIQKIVTHDGSDPRDTMINVYGTNWAWEYFPDEATENGDGTVTVHGRRKDYTYTMLPTIER